MTGTRRLWLSFGALLAATVAGTIGILGLLTDLAFQWLYRLLFPHLRLRS